MSRYCKCFISNKQNYLLQINEVSKTEPLIHYYDTIHKEEFTTLNSDFKQIEYNKTISEVYKMKRKLGR
jgi:hypothetical protein